ncbi:MAG: 3-keto-disaccharide hydrolase [Bryobacteraceae bacterium]
MKPARLLFLCLFLCSTAFSIAAFAEEGFKPLFNGKNLDGWDGDPRLWSVRDGMIVGSTEGVPLQHNEFLIAKGDYANFILRVEMKLRNHNSGIQFRSEALPDWVVQGYQADAAADNYWGNIYDEKGTRGTMVDGWPKAKTVVKLKDWNEYEITCDGDRIRLKLNGLETADLHDSKKLDGAIALQLHAGPPMEAYFRNIRIKILK